MLRASIFALALLALASLAPVHAITQTATFSQTISFDGVTVNVSGTFTVDTTAKTLSGTASVSVVNSTSGATIFSKTFAISLSFASTNNIRVVLAIPAIPLTLAASCSVDVTTGSASCMVSRDPDVNHDGIVNIIDFGMLGASYGSTAGSTRFNPAVDLDANGRVDIIDAGIMGADYGATVLS